MIDRNRQRFRQQPEYKEQMTRLKEEYPKVCSIANRYDLLIFLVDLVLFIVIFIALDKLFIAPSMIKKFNVIMIFTLMLSIGIGREINLHLLDMKDEAIDKYVFKARRTNHSK